MKRVERREKGRERNINMREMGCLLHTPDWELGLQPRHVPWLGIEPVIFGSQAGTQSTEPHQPGLFFIFFW